MTPPTTPRGPRGDVEAGEALLKLLGGTVKVQLCLPSALVVEVHVHETTTIEEMRAGLLRSIGGSLCRDEAVLVNAKGELFDDPWATPFRGVPGDGEVFMVIVRQAQTPYYQNMADRRGRTAAY